MHSNDSSVFTFRSPSKILSSENASRTKRNKQTVFVSILDAMSNRVQLSRPDAAEISDCSMDSEEINTPAMPDGFSLLRIFVNGRRLTEDQFQSIGSTAFHSSNETTTVIDEIFSPFRRMDFRIDISGRLCNFIDSTRNSLCVAMKNVFFLQICFSVLFEYLFRVVKDIVPVPFANVLDGCFFNVTLIVTNGYGRSKVAPNLNLISVSGQLRIFSKSNIFSSSFDLRFFVLIIRVFDHTGQRKCRWWNGTR